MAILSIKLTPVLFNITKWIWFPAGFRAEKRENKIGFDLGNFIEFATLICMVKFDLSLNKLV